MENQNTKVPMKSENSCLDNMAENVFTLKMRKSLHIYQCGHGCLHSYRNKNFKMSDR